MDYKNINVKILPKSDHNFNAISMNIPMTFFPTEMEKLTLKFIWNSKDPEQPKKKKNLEKEEYREFTFPNFKTFYKPTIIKTVLYYHKERHTDQRN